LQGESYIRIVHPGAETLTTTSNVEEKAVKRPMYELIGDAAALGAVLACLS
jgi:hypothetical protein